MRQQELTARQRKLARATPRIVLRNSELDTHIPDLLPLDLIRERQAPAALRAPRRLGFHEGAQLPHAFEEGFHRDVEAAVHERQAERHVA